MAAGHRAAAAPFALGYTWTLASIPGEVEGSSVVPVPIALACGLLVLASTTWPDLDHSRFKGRVSVPAFFAWLVRVSAWLGYRLRTAKDRHREDFHRGPSHCVEWALLLGFAFAYGLEWAAPVLGGSAWALGGAVTIGCVVHIGADAMTPSGVPVSALYNLVVHGEVWRRHSLSLFSTDSVVEHLAWTPGFYVLTAAMGLGMVGLLGPLLGFMVGVS